MEAGEQRGRAIFGGAGARASGSPRVGKIGRREGQGGGVRVNGRGKQSASLPPPVGFILAGFILAVLRAAPAGLHLPVPAGSPPPQAASSPPGLPDLGLLPRALQRVRGPEARAPCRWLSRRSDTQGTLRLSSSSAVLLLPYLLLLIPPLLLLPNSSLLCFCCPTPPSYSPPFVVLALIVSYGFYYCLWIADCVYII